MTTFSDLAAAFDKHRAAEMARATDGLGPLTAACIKKHWHLGEPRRGMDVATAFALMQSFANSAPAWCNAKKPIAKALQAAVLIRTLTAEMTRLDKSRQSFDWFNLAIADCKSADMACHGATPPRGSDMTPKAYAAATSGARKRIPGTNRSAAHFLRSLPDPRWVGPPRERLAFGLGDLNIPQLDERYRFELTDDAFRAVYQLDGCVVVEDEVHAARLVVSHANVVLLKALANKARWRSPVVDWSVIKLILAHVPLRDAAAALGLDKSGSNLSRRFDNAIAAIAESVGDFSLDMASPDLEPVPPRLKPQIEYPTWYNWYEGWNEKRPVPVVRDFQIWPKIRVRLNTDRRDRAPCCALPERRRHDRQIPSWPALRIRQTSRYPHLLFR